MTEIVNFFNVNIIVDFFVILFFSLLGSAVKVYLRIVKDPAYISSKRYRNTKNKMVEIFLSTTTATIITFTISDHIERMFGIRGIVCSSFIMGLIGFELLNRISTIEGLIDMLSNIVTVYRNCKTMQAAKKDKDISNSDDDDNKH